jgi:hypothetical protein
MNSEYECECEVVGCTEICKYFYYYPFNIAYGRYDGRCELHKITIHIDHAGFILQISEDSYTVNQIMES